MDKRLKATASATSAFATAFRRLDDTRFAGHVLWREAPYLHFIVEILIDGESVGLVRAENSSAELISAGEAASDHGFVYNARKHQLAGHHQIEARIANLAVPIGIPIDLKRQPLPDASGEAVGRVDWLGGLRLAGTVTVREKAPAELHQISVRENGALVAQASARRWTTATVNRDDLASAHFDLQLPASLADGRAHQLTVTDQAGRALEGSPVHVLAFTDPLRQLVNNDQHLAPEQTRAEWFDRLLPMSVPFQNYSEWKERFPHAPPVLKTEPPVRVVVVGSGDPEKTLAQLADQKYANWSATVLASTDDGNFAWKQLHEAVAADAPKDSIAVFVRTATSLCDTAIVRLAHALAETPDAVAAYGDIETIAPDGTLKPLFFGAFDYERMLEQGYAATLFAIRADRLKIPADEKTGNLARLLLALCDADGAQGGTAIVHVPGVLATIREDAHAPSQAEIESASSGHLRARKIKVQSRAIQGAVLPAVQIKRRHAANLLVSVIIPTRDRVDLLAPCIDSLTGKTTHKNLEIVIVDNGSSAPETVSFLKARQRKGDRIVDAAGPFNYSHLNNVGVASAKGDIICLLNNDTEILHPDWLDELLSRLSDPTVGAVAPKLIWPNRMVQHGGIVLGPNFAASDAFNDCLDVDAGYGDLLRVAHEATALSAACMLVRRSDYIAAKGFDEIAFPVLFNDVDFCLRLRAMGKRNVFTPHTSLLHRESATRQRDSGYSQKSRFQRELKLLRARWGDVLASDPLYSPNLNLDPYPFSALAWPPRPGAARLNIVPKPKNTSAL